VLEKGVFALEKGRVCVREGHVCVKEGRVCVREGCVRKSKGRVCARDGYGLLSLPTHTTDIIPRGGGPYMSRGSTSHATDQSASSCRYPWPA